MSKPHTRAPIHEVNRAGGAYVRRKIFMGGEHRLPGRTLSAEELAGVPMSNLQALISTGILELFPVGPVGMPAGEALGPVERFAVHTGGGQYHVLEGRRLTETPISREEADAMVETPPAPSPADDDQDTGENGETNDFTDGPPAPPADDAAPRLGRQPPARTRAKH